MTKHHTYDWMKKEFMETVRASMSRNDIEPIQKLFQSLPEEPNDRRAALDQGFRDYLLLLLKTSGESMDSSIWETFLSRCVEASRCEMATVQLPVVLLGDLFDSLTLDKCEQLFTFVENGVHIWKENLFFSGCKNNLLRMCNDLLRRLSRSQNTVFCGRILLFLAKFFPFSERSGLNIVSEFNLDNVTEFSGEDSLDITDETPDDIMEEANVDEIKIDYNLYSKFWSLQNFFRNPILVYNKVHWKTFTSNTENVLAAFKSFKLEGIQTKNSLSANEIISDASSNDHYFAKFLTNQKLLELQLCDINFRRYVLVQFLILVQYLNATVKFKNDNQELNGHELDWVKQTTDEVYNLLKDTPPDGETFTKTVQNILKREEFWNNWKNEGCPAIKKVLPPADDAMDDDKHQNIRRRGKKRIGQLAKESHAQKRFILGNPELTKLWNYSHKNLEACRAPERNFLMSLEDYFREAIEQLDPAAMVEDQYKVVNDGNFGWRSLRLLALQSSNFFTNTNQHINKLPEYLETMIRKIAKEMPIIPPTEEGKLEMNENNELINEADTEVDEEELLKADDKRDESRAETPETTQKPPLISSEILDAVAQTIASQWRNLADKLGYKDTIQYIEESLATDLERARYVEQLWVEEEPDLTPDQLSKTLDSYGFAKAAIAVRELI